MTTTVSKDLAALEKMTIGELHDRYAELFGERIHPGAPGHRLIADRVAETLGPAIAGVAPPR